MPRSELGRPESYSIVSFLFVCVGGVRILCSYQAKDSSRAVARFQPQHIPPTLKDRRQTPKGNILLPRSSTALFSGPTIAVVACAELATLEETE
jgi:hypothetical protein